MARTPVHAFGAASGPLVVYFHGAPGAPSECARFDAAARRAGVRLVCLERAATPGDGEAYFRALAGEVEALAGGRPAHLLGFSLGAFVALRTAACMKDAAAGLDLVSAAAPLESGDFFGQMAGGPVFRLAQRSAAAFRAATRLQGALAAIAPGVLFDAMFAEASGADRALAAEGAFRAEVKTLLKASYGPGRRGYIRDVLEYVRPWADRIAEVRAPVRIWHGDADGWAPVAMARRLEALAPGPATTEILAGLSHYSALFESAPRILALVGEAGRRAA